MVEETRRKRLNGRDLRRGRYVLQIEGDVVVPLEMASDRAEPAARTLRPKLHRVWNEYLRPLEDAAVHWNAAMREMVHTGFMHNSMRMHWAKKILEWTPDRRPLFGRPCIWNNRYFLDGRDAKVAWSVGLHDRPGPSGRCSATCAT